jgi:hypothetical protein
VEGAACSASAVSVLAGRARVYQAGTSTAPLSAIMERFTGLRVRSTVSVRNTVMDIGVTRRSKPTWTSIQSPCCGFLKR